MSIVKEYNTKRADIVLAHLVKPYRDGRGRTKYEYVSTRVYRPIEDIIEERSFPRDVGFKFKLYNASWQFASWSDVPMIDITTKRLVGKNKELYCTLISVRVYELPEGSGEDGANYFVYDGDASVSKRFRTLGYTFMDVNGDRCYLTAQQVRDGNIIEHTHSTLMDACATMLHRNVNLSACTQVGTLPKIEVSDVDTSIEDTEVVTMRIAKALTGGWFAKNNTGALVVDEDALLASGLEEIEIPEGIRYIPEGAFTKDNPAIRRIKLPKSLQIIAEQAFTGLRNLEDINITNSVRRLNLRAFTGCTKLNELDLSCVAELRGFLIGVRIRHLILPDVLDTLIVPQSIRVGLLEFRNVSRVRQRVLKAVQGGTKAPGNANTGIYASKIETNGPVVLGDYKQLVHCVDASSLEPNIVGITNDSTFCKVDAQGNPQPWVIGGKTEYIHGYCEGGCHLTEEVCKQGKLKALDLYPNVVGPMPKSLLLLGGTTALDFARSEYPNVRYAAWGLFSADAPQPSRSTVLGSAALRRNLPSLQWLLPKGSVLSLAQAKRAEQKIRANWATIRGDMRTKVQEFGYDLSNDAERYEFTRTMLCSTDAVLAENAYGGSIMCLLMRYGMIYIGDYNKD